MREKLVYLIILSQIAVFSEASDDISSLLTEIECQNVVSGELKSEIRSYQKTANLILETILSGPFKGRTYKNLADFTDTIGPRVTGSKNLEEGIDYMLKKMKADGLENVHGEVVPLPVPYWVRGEESAFLFSSRNKSLSIIGMGYTITTPPEGITAPVVVVTSFDELALRAADVPGKIVVFNQEYQGYAKTTDYREKGPVEAAKLGALACLVRSVTPFSISSPHTGYVEYEANVKKIPAAAMTVEDAQFLHRMQSRGERLVIQLILQGTFSPSVSSRNAIGDLVGSEKPASVVGVSCHIDSWDVGDGVLDDAGGCLVTVEALALLRHLNLKPKRTIRAILFTAEEQGYFGAIQYVKDHISEIDKFNALLESDFGTFNPLGLDFAGSSTSACILYEILQLVKSTNATSVRKKLDVGSDTTEFQNKGVPTIGLYNDERKVLWYHHTKGDMITLENPDEIDLCLAVWAVASYVLADMNADLPRI